VKKLIDKNKKEIIDSKLIEDIDVTTIKKNYFDYCFNNGTEHNEIIEFFSSFNLVQY